MALWEIPSSVFLDVLFPKFASFSDSAKVILLISPSGREWAQWHPNLTSSFTPASAAALWRAPLGNGQHPQIKPRLALFLHSPPASLAETCISCLTPAPVAPLPKSVVNINCIISHPVMPTLLAKCFTNPSTSLSRQPPLITQLWPITLLFWSLDSPSVSGGNYISLTQLQRLNEIMGAQTVSCNYLDHGWLPEMTF